MDIQANRVTMTLSDADSDPMFELVPALSLVSYIYQFQYTSLESQLIDNFDPTQKQGDKRLY